MNPKKAKAQSVKSAPAMKVHPRLVTVTFQVPPIMAEVLPVLSRLNDMSLNEYVIERLAVAIKGDFEEAGRGFGEDLDSQMSGIPFDAIEEMSFRGKFKKAMKSVERGGA